MILSIVPEITSDCVLSCPPNVKVIDYKTFNSLEIHPFIATHNWEYIEIILGKGIRGGYIKQVLTKCNLIVAKIPKNINLDYEIVSRLMEIYPMLASELRSSFMKKQDVTNILVEAGVIFE